MTPIDELPEETQKTVTSGNAYGEQSLNNKPLEFAAVYEQNYRVLLGLATSKFHIPESDADAIVHEVFLSYFLTADTVIDARAWLIGALTKACRGYWKLRGRSESLPERAAETIADPSVNSDVDFAREAFAVVSGRCRDALRMRYLEGMSIPEVATELQTSTRFAAKLISRCLKQARERYAKAGPQEKK